MLYLLQIIYKWLSIIFISILSLFNIGNYTESEALVSNSNNEKDVSIVSTIIPYATNYIYNSKWPSNKYNVLKEGVLGVSYEDSNGTHVIQEPIEATVEQGTGPYGIFVGRLTGYGPDCPGCSKVGNVGCLTKNKKRHSLINDGIYYTDDEYGQVRIVAAAKYFPCGTIIQVTKDDVDPFYVVVLDRGGSMNYAWSEGRVWMDLAYESNTLATVLSDNMTGRNVEFSVQRWGW